MLEGMQAHLEKDSKKIFGHLVVAVPDDRSTSCIKPELTASSDCCSFDPNPILSGVCTRFDDT
jgi:hypothetical protein